MNAEQLAAAIGGHKGGDGWMARCPAHHDRTPSLSIRDAENGRILVHCHAGCGQRDVISALRSHGLWGQGGERPEAQLPMPTGPRAVRDEVRRSRQAQAIWEAARPAQGTLVEQYLASRSLRLCLFPSLRFLSNQRHRAGGDWPCLIARVTRGVDGMPLGLHRTFLAPDGSGKAPVDPAKMMLGPCRGGVVRLAAVYEELAVGEGIETVLSFMQATGLPGWAALSTSGLLTLGLPADIKDVVVLADGDGPGERAAREAATRWTKEGRRVRIARAPRGLDFNDVLMGRFAEANRAAS